jgi:bacillithiol system protein YtxJ
MDASQREPVIIFKYSSECGTSSELKIKLEKEGNLKFPIYVVVVQDHPVLSKKIAEMFDITHESPQIIILNKGKVTYTAHHRDIDIQNFKFT